MNNASFYLLLVFIALLFNSCKQELDDFKLNYQYEYFPLDTGSYWIYEVDSIVFFEGVADTSKVYIKEQVESFYLDNQGRNTARIVRSYSRDTTFNWQIRDVWFANKTQTTAEKIEENLRFVKLLFPPAEEQTWKGNQYIQPVENIEWLSDWDYTVSSLNVPATFGNVTYDSTLTVLQRDEENLIEKTFGKEVFATQKGLVYKELLRLTKQNTAVPWTQPRDGFIVKLTLKEYGIE